MQFLELQVKDVSDQQLHHYRFRARNHAKLTGRLFINDVEIFSFTPERRQISCNDVYNWLIPGENHVTLSIESSAAEAEDSFNPLYACSLHGMNTIGLPGVDNCLWEIEVLELDQSPPLTIDYKFVFSQRQVPSSQLWQAAEVFEHLSEDEQAGILKLKDDLYKALANGDADAVMQMYSYVLQEEATIRNQKLEDGVNKLKEELSELSSMAKQGILTLRQSDSHYFNHLAADRVIQLCGDAGEPALTMLDDKGEAIAINIYAAKIAGQWQLVRR